MFVLLGVLFSTLKELKVLGLIQLRKGSLKVVFLGLIQPFSVAIKLCISESVSSLKVNYLIFYFSLVIILFLSLFIWVSVLF